MLDVQPNPDSVVGLSDREQWNTGVTRHANFHRPHSVGQYGISLASRGVLRLQRNIDRRIRVRAPVTKLTDTTDFSAKVVPRHNT